MNTLEWNDKYSVSISVIDEQHKKLINIINEAIDAMQFTNDSEEISGILDEVTEYAKEHFANEET